MRLVFGIVLVLGLGLAGFAVYMAQGYIQQYQVALAAEQQARAAQVPLVDIYVAARQLKYGEKLTPDAVQMIKYPEPHLPEGVFRTMEELFPEGESEPRAVLRTIELNEPMLAVKLTEPGEDAGVSTRLGPGMRAFAVNVDVSSGVSGFVSPGDRVDIYWSGAINNREITQLIESAVQVIAIDQMSDTENSSPTVARTVTLEATPEQVAALAQAQATGRLSLALVGAADVAVLGKIEVDQRDLLGIQEAAPVAAPEPQRVCSITTRRGGEAVQIPIPCTN